MATVVETLQAAVPIARMELLDEVARRESDVKLGSNAEPVSSWYQNEAKGC